MKTALLILAGLLLTSTVTWSGETYTLEQLTRLAREHNPVFKIADIDRKIAVAEYRDGRALPNPEVEVARGRFEADGEPLKTTISEMGAKWSLPNPIYRHYRLQAARKNITAADIEAQAQKNGIIKEVKTLYYRIRFLAKSSTFLAEKRRILEALNTITRAKVSIGEAKAIDALRSSVEIQRIKTDQFKSEKALNSEKFKLNETLNNTLPADFTIPGQFPFKPLPALEDQLGRMVESSPVVRLAANGSEREKKSLNAARASLIEAVEVFAEQEQEAEGKKWKVGVGIEIPLFNRKGAAIRKAKLMRQKADIQLEHAKKHHFADLQRLLSEIRTLEKEIETFQGAILKEGSENRQLSERLYKEGEVPLVVFLDAQNSFFDVQERYYEAITEWNILKAELEALLGEEL